MDDVLEHRESKNQASALVVYNSYNSSMVTLVTVIVLYSITSQ